MKLNLSWWKILGVILTIYVLIAGFKVPLQPGILEYSENKAFAGQAFSTDLTTYNTYLKKATDLNVWIWLPNDQLIKANGTEVINDTKVKADFLIPTDIEIKNGKSILATLMIDNAEEGHYFIRRAVTIKNESEANLHPGQFFDLSVIKSKTRFAFPFQHILYETLRNTFFHVAIWMSMFALLLVSCYHSIMYLKSSDQIHDKKSSSLTTVALVFGIAGLLTGSVWAKYTWGAFWTSDVKLNMTAISLLIYFGYWILRGSLNDMEVRARISSVFNLFAFVCLMILVMVIPRLSEGSLHPGNGGNPAFSTYDLDSAMRLVFYPAIVAYFLIGLWISELLFRYAKLEEKITFDI
ncbi:MAG: cytochrome c biogenesis protein CcsA [Saprospiraceae bacterium]|nr:cytochrome c biogenesis protein [Bacteroidia bacterium]NNE13968.1 cytochrome c biogenesis protein CcsA [Saprospiraceae bacterium]NNL92772.1 cytochrome c biogenesis protein CcsA [Saprospiraceae bacterium]